MGADDKETFKAKEVDENNRDQIVSEAHDIEGWTKLVLFSCSAKGNSFSRGILFQGEFFFLKRGKVRGDSS